MEQLVPPEPKIIIQKPGIGDAMLAAFTALGFAVSARFLLFLSVIGAFVIAVMAMTSQTIMAVVVLAVYCLLTIIPLIVIEIQSKHI